MRRSFPLLSLLLVATAAAQERTITVQNLAPFARREWAKAVVPFAKGAVKELPDLHADKRPTVWQPIGARWDDGSLRQALCLFPVEMKPLSELPLRLVEGAGPKLPKKVAIADPVRGGSVTITVRVRQGQAATVANPTFVRELESNRARRVSLYRCRIGKTGLVFEMILGAWLGQPHCDATVGLFFSDNTTQAMEVAVDSVDITVRGMRLILRHAGRLAIDTTFTATGSRVTLLNKTKFGDGQGIRRTGVLSPPLDQRDALRDQTLQAAALGPVLAATSWRRSRAYGPFGMVPEPPPWLRGQAGRLALAKRHSAFVRSDQPQTDPFQRFPFALVKDPGATGAQNDFGVIKLAPVASTGLPSLLLEVEPSILQEACRPVHFFEADGSPIQAKNHPEWVQWDGRTHWHCGASKDRLGKPCPAPKHETHGWKGKDRQHWSSNYLCGFYLLTGSHWARREIENEVQLFLAGQTLRKGIATSGPGAPRAIGRMLHLGCWLYQCTGDRALLDRMHARVEQCYLPTWHGRSLPEGRVRPLAVRGPAGNILNGKVRYWTPWEESIAVTGLAAFYQLTGDANAWQLAAEISLNVLEHGWSIDTNGARIGYQIRWQAEGQPLTRTEILRSDKSNVSWAGGGIALWSMAAVEVALHFAKERKLENLVEKATRILADLRKGRERPPRDGWWDEYREWDAIRLDR